MQAGPLAAVGASPFRSESRQSLQGEPRPGRGPARCLAPRQRCLAPLTATARSREGRSPS